MKMPEMSRFEQQLDELIRRMETLQAENRFLRRELAHAQQNCATIQQNNQQLAQQVRAIIKNLQGMTS